MAAFPQHFPPKWQEHNVEVVTLVDEPPNAKGGVLCDGEGHVHAFYTLAMAVEEGAVQEYGYCIPSNVLMPLVEHIRGAGGRITPPIVPSLEIDICNAELQKLRRLPAKIRPTEEWLKKLGALGKSVLQIDGVTSKGPCDGLVMKGDLLVAVGGESVASVQAVEAQLHQAAVQARLQRTEGPLQVELTVLRRGKRHNFKVAAPYLSSDGTTRLLVWHGVILREIPRAVREFIAVPAGVHISQTMLGSPGETDGIEGDILVAVNGTPTPTLDAVVALGQQMLPALPAPTPSGERLHLRVETAGISGQRFMGTLEPDQLFWPTFEISQNQRGEWSCVELTGQ